VFFLLDFQESAPSIVSATKDGTRSEVRHTVAINHIRASIRIGKPCRKECSHEGIHGVPELSPSMAACLLGNGIVQRRPANGPVKGKGVKAKAWLLIAREAEHWAGG
jgi:hypothetical protein